MELTRRTLISGLAATGLAASAFAALPALASEAGAGVQVGFGTGIGAKGDVPVAVVVENGAISAILCGDNIESRGPGQTAIQLMPARIVEAQSTNVDTVSGATLTSLAILSAVREALEGLGLADQFDVEAPTASVKRADEDVDVVIVGAGGAGMTCALQLVCPEFDGVKNDLNVLVLEKLDFAGGSTALAGGSTSVIDGLRASDVSGCHSTAEDLVDLLRVRNSWGVNEPLALAIASKSVDTVQKFVEFGGPFTTSTGGVQSRSGHSYQTVGASGHIQLRQPDGSTRALTNEGGHALADFLETKLRQLGVEIRCGAAATELVMDGSAVAGVRVKEGDASYVVHAKKTVLACGGFVQNADAMKEINGELIPSYIPWCTAGSTGDAFAMTADLDIPHCGEGALLYFGTDARNGIFSSLNNAYRGRHAVIVNELGKRVGDESGDEFEFAYNIAQAPNGHLFAIIDADSENAETFEQWVEAGNVKRADTLEELAEVCDIDADALVATVETYNADSEAGADSVFGTPAESMYPVRTAPFYAGEIVPCVIGGLVGLQVNESCQPVTSAGEPVENLYAVGEVCEGGNIMSKLYSGGYSIMTALNSGRIAAEHIAQSF
ncbi:MAG: FAD-dependent oxidoreductase [Coriobacteriia bacterium]|nr:FAD-dependent oxidoreductase [Coriobacteriia bacterium]MBS5478654.1 FAD-dependent oxidoreductase [Coriobacteriia bacterium]